MDLKNIHFDSLMLHTDNLACETKSAAHLNANANLNAFVPDGALQVKKESEGISKFCCAYCTKCFAKKQQLQNHIKTHTKEKNFKCEKCDKSFVHKQQLANHEKTHTDKKDFKCIYCKKGFKLKQQLQVHLKTHTGERSFQCSMCDKSFITKQQLENHINAQLGIKPFMCHVCQKSFTHKQQLVRHKKRHDIEVDFSLKYDVKFKTKEHIFKNRDINHKAHNSPYL